MQVCVWRAFPTGPVLLDVTWRSITLKVLRVFGSGVLPVSPKRRGLWERDTRGTQSTLHLRGNLQATFCLALHRAAPTVPLFWQAAPRCL